VETLCHQLLAGAALADHEHGPVERRGAARPLDRVQKGGGLADEVSASLHANDWGYFPSNGKSSMAGSVGNSPKLAVFSHSRHLARSL
jgi:hypothetical protein